MKKYDEIVAIVEGMKADVDKLDNGVKAAGARVRKALMDIKILAHEGRKEVSAAIE